MPHFLLFYLALALIFSGTMLSSCAKAGVNSQRIKGIEITAHSTPAESADKSVIEVNGVSFETLISDSALSIPQSGGETPVKFGLRLTNKTQKNIRFSRFYTLSLNLVKADGGVLSLDGGNNGLMRPKESFFPLTNPGESVTFFLEGKLFWQNHQLLLEWSDGLGGFWSFADLKPGVYKLQFIYRSYEATMRIYEPEERILAGIWTGQVKTPLVEFYLIPL